MMTGVSLFDAISSNRQCCSRSRFADISALLHARGGQSHSGHPIIVENLGPKNVEHNLQDQGSTDRSKQSKML